MKSKAVPGRFEVPQVHGVKLDVAHPRRRREIPAPPDRRTWPDRSRQTGCPASACASGIRLSPEQQPISRILACRRMPHVQPAQHRRHRADRRIRERMAHRRIDAGFVKFLDRAGHWMKKVAFRKSAALRGAPNTSGHAIRETHRHNRSSRRFDATKSPATSTSFIASADLSAPHHRKLLPQHPAGQRLHRPMARTGDQIHRQHTARRHRPPEVLHQPAIPLAGPEHVGFPGQIDVIDHHVESPRGFSPATDRRRR